MEVDDRLLELGFGEIEGLTPDEIGARGLGEVFTAWRQGLPPAYPAGAETFEAAAARLSSLYGDASPVSDGCVVLIGHSHALRILIVSSILGMEPESHRRLRLDHATLTEVQWEEDAPRVVTLNVRHVARL